MKHLYIFLIMISSIVELVKCVPSNPKNELAPLVNKYVEYWNTGEFEGIEEVLHSDFELRMTPKYDPEQGIDLFKETITKWRSAYPDFHLEVKEVFFTENQAAGLWEITATNSGIGSHPPTGKSIKVTGMSILHFSDGKIKDEWIASNNSLWLRQLGFKLVSPFEDKE